MSEEIIEEIVEEKKEEIVEKAVEPKSDFSEKEFIELFNALDELALFVGKVAKDGKVNAADFPHLVELATKFDVIMEGIKGVDRAMPPALTRHYAFMSLNRVWGVIDKFKEGKDK